MGKRKSKRRPQSNTKQDGRGYATSSTSTVSKNNSLSNKDKDASKRLVVSNKARTKLSELLDELKSTLITADDNDNNNNNNNGGSDTKGEGNERIRIDLNDRKVLKKAMGLHDKLEELNFARSHIQSILIGLASAGTPSSHTHTGTNHTTTTLPSDSTTPNFELFSLNDALDWACLHLSSTDLPTLFVELDSLDERKEEGTVRLLRQTSNSATTPQGTHRPLGDPHDSSPIDTMPVVLPSDCGTNTNSNADADADADASTYGNQETKKQGDGSTRDEMSTSISDSSWREDVLRRYEYEQADDDDDNHDDDNNDDNNDNDDNDNNDQNIADNTNNNTHHIPPTTPPPPSTTSTSTSPPTLSPEETLLQKLNQQIELDRTDLNDDGANYMRSKYETADIQKRLRKNENRAKGLKAKLEKQKRMGQREQQEPNTMVDEKGGDGSTNHNSNDMDHKNEEDDDDQGGGLMMNLFDEDEDTTSTTTTNATTTPTSHPEPSHPLPPPPPPPQTLLPSIPPSWTGKTPKLYLLEHCSKRRYPKPLFQKLAHTTNGCRAVVRFDTKKTTTSSSSTKTSFQRREPLTVNSPGPYCTFDDGVEYASTQALYELNPTLPLYVMFPPVFRNLWKGWVEGVKEEKLGKLREKQEKKREDRTQMMEEVRRMLKGVVVMEEDGGKLEEDGNEEEEGEDGTAVMEGKERKKVVLQEETILDNWDDESSDGNDVDKTIGAAVVGDGHDNGGSSSSNYNKNDHDAQHHDHIPNNPTSLGKRLQNAFLQHRNTPTYLTMSKIRSQLPIHSYRTQLLTAVRSHPITVVHAETGAGKTTQLPSYLLEDALSSGYGDAINVLCTQPRRISAISVAERVAEELDEKLGNGNVGYAVRGESKRCRSTRLLFCTTGVVLRRMQEDPELTGVTHVVVDEVHERQWQIDFLLVALRRLVGVGGRRRDLKVVLMSATLDEGLFTDFFRGVVGGGEGGRPTVVVSVPGRTFPVNEYYLEDVLEATGHVVEEGSRNAVRSEWGRSGKGEATLWVTGKGGEKRREVVSLGEDSKPLEVESDEYAEYSMATRRSMSRVDESVVNYDLIEDLLTLMLVHPDKNFSITPPEYNLVTSSPDESSSYRSLSDGSILIFLPGMGEIRTLTERLKSSRIFGNRNKFDVIPLHSSLSSKDQKRAFQIPRRGCQKIILATNIAETSVTIADCVCVIDTGLVREVRQDRRSSTSALVIDWTSKASGKQRSGRAGRVQPGICCKLYSSRTAHSVMKQQSMPELQRVPLEEVCLSILAGGLAANCTDFLLQAPQPPEEVSIQAALQVLEEVGAVNPRPPKTTLTTAYRHTETLTPLGRHLAKLPVHARLGKMLIFGALFKVLDKVLTIAASLSAKSPFVTNFDDSQQAAAKHRSFAHGNSDFLTICNVWEAYRAASAVSDSNARRFCAANFLSRSALTEIGDMRRQFVELLNQIGFVWKMETGHVETSVYNTNGKKEEIVAAVVCAGLYPNVAHAVKGPHNTPPTLFDKNMERVYFHNSSVNHKKVLEGEWVAFHEKFATSRVFLSSTSIVNPFSLLLFGGSIVINHLERKAIIDDRIVLNMAAQTGVMFRELRHKLTMLLDEIIEVINVDSKHDTLIDGIVKLLSCE